MTKKIDFPTVIAKIEKIAKRGFCWGQTQGKPGTKNYRFCVERAICEAMGEPERGDRPSCVPHFVSSYKVDVNDMGGSTPYGWSSPRARAISLLPLAIAQLGSEGVVKARDFHRALKSWAAKVGVEGASLKHFGPEELFDLNLPGKNTTHKLAAAIGLLALRDCKSPGARKVNPEEFKKAKELVIKCGKIVRDREAE